MTRCTPASPRALRLARSSRPNSKLYSIATLPGLTLETNIVGNNIETGGEALSWLRRTLSGGPGWDMGYDEITALAATAPPGCEGLIVTPWLAGARSPLEDRHLRAAFVNVSLRSDRAMLARAALEGAALNIGWLFGHTEKFLRQRVPSVRILGASCAGWRCGRWSAWGG